MIANGSTGSPGPALLFQEVNIGLALGALVPIHVVAVPGIGLLVAHPRGHFNRLIERRLAELGGIKSLYSDSFYELDEFWSIFDRPAYDRLKVKYDPRGRLSDLYRKCVLRE